jgi:hypothetical protein
VPIEGSARAADKFEGRTFDTKISIGVVGAERSLGVQVPVLFLRSVNLR